jgi:ABC-type transport system involved in multi-copper enzyme maturation permease subunit
MKMAAAFIALLACVLAVLPLTMQGDGTLAGRLRTFLNYSTSATAGVMIVATVFLSVAVIADDVRERQIFSIAVKPVSRPGYVLGRWLGVVMLNVIVLVIAWVIIYSVAMYLREGEALNAKDRRTVETEVLTARRDVLPEPIDVSDEVAERIAEMKRAGDFDAALQGYLPQSGGSQREAMAMLHEELTKQAREAAQSTGPGGWLEWRFRGVAARGSQTSGQGTITRTGSARDGELRVVRIKAPQWLIGQLVYRGPVQIMGIEGDVWSLGEKHFDAALPTDEVPQTGDPLATGKAVDVTAYSTLQLSFEAVPSASPEDDTFYSLWVIGQPGRLKRQAMRKDQYKTKVTMTLPTDVIDPNGETIVRMRNLRSPRTGRAPSVLILREDISLLYRVGAFEPNLVRGMLLTLVQVAYVAALGVLAGSAFSFPVGVLVSFGFLPFGVAREWISQSVTNVAGTEYDDVFTFIGRQIYTVMSVLLPDLETASAATSLTDGMAIAWGMGGENQIGLLASAGPTGLRIVVCLALAFVVFQKRELARVQV